MLVQLLTVTTVTRKNPRDPPLLRFFDRLGFGVGAASFLADFDWLLRKLPAKCAHDIGETFTFTLASMAFANS